MEGVVRRGKWNKKAPVGAVLLMCMFLPTLTALQCSEEDYLNEDAGICCNRCARGYRLVEMCKERFQRSNCTACPEGYYTDTLNSATRCDECKKCNGRKREVQVETCQPHKNTVCQCKEGYYKSIIDSAQFQCRACKKCAANENLMKPCDANNNTVCECKKNFYRIKKNGPCQPCENCTAGCEQFCTTTPRGATGRQPQNDSLINIIGGLAASAMVLLVLVSVVTFMVTKWVTKKKLQSRTCQSPDASPDLFTQILITDEEPSNDVGLNAAAPPSPPQCEQEHPSSLPDCVPFEIKWPDLVYMVLDLVPVLRVKELVRSLGVRDMEIEQIELDYQSCREAHYQMLRVWAEKGSRAGGLLHQPMLHELLGKLREMHLCRAAEELETKYGIQ